MKNIPTNGSVVWVQGHEFTASNITIETENGRRLMRFTGTCTTHPCNDSIRHTSYNGGRYGWAVS